MAIIGNIQAILNAAGMPAELTQWTAPVVYPYYVFDYAEDDTDDDIGYTEATITIAGFDKGTFLTMLMDADVLKAALKNGKRTVYTDVIHDVTYERGYTVPIEELDIKRFEIKLKAKEWRI